MYNANSRQVLGPTTVPKLESGPEACQRTSWLPTRMHLPLCKIFFLNIRAKCFFGQHVFFLLILS